MRNLIELKPIGNNFALFIGRAEEGIMLRIDHKMTVVKPDELRKAIEQLSSDYEFAHLQYRK